MARINDFKLSLNETNPKKKLLIMLNELPGGQKSKTVLSNYISSIEW